METYFSVSQTAKLLNVSTRTVYRWIDSGVLKADKTDSGRVLISEKDILGKKEKSRSSGIACIYVYDNGGTDFAKRSVNHILNKENLVRSRCAIFIDTNDRSEREKLLDFVATKASSRLYIVSMDNLVQNNDINLRLLERYLDVVNCDIKIVY